jgi:hypothetical protein
MLSSILPDQTAGKYAEYLAHSVDGVTVGEHCRTLHCQDDDSFKALTRQISEDGLYGWSRIGSESALTLCNLTMFINGAGTWVNKMRTIGCLVTQSVFPILIEVDGEERLIERPEDIPMGVGFTVRRLKLGK